MKKTLITLVFIALTLFLYWYFGKENAFTIPERPKRPIAMKFVPSFYEQNLGDCANSVNNCLKIDFEYPLAKYGYDSIRNRINETIKQDLSYSIIFGEEEPETLNFDTLVLELHEEYNDFREDMPDGGMGWVFESKAKLLYQSDDLAVIEHSSFSYTGGAHPNGFTNLLNFNLKDGSLFYLEDLLTDTVAFRPVLEANFKKAKNIAANEPLSKIEGLFFTDRLPFPENYGIVREGLKCVYNTYEIAPYAAGKTEFVIPWKEMEGNIKGW